MTSLRQLLPAALLAATAAFGLSAVGTLATASAAPTEWDIGLYDDCMGLNPSGDPSEKIAWARKCCLDSGGVWNDAMGKCQSPPKDAVASGTRATPKAPVQVFEPSRPTTTRVPGGVYSVDLAVAP